VTARRVAAAAVLLAGVIHLLPLLGVIGAERLRTLYGVDLSDGNLLVLMRHRAVLFGLLGSLLVLAAFRPGLMPLAIAGGGVSAASFLVFALLEGGLNDAMHRVLAADIAALVCLAVAAAALWSSPSAAVR